MAPPPTSCQQDVTLFRLPVCSRSVGRSGRGGERGRGNHAIARKPDHLRIIQYSLERRGSMERGRTERVERGDEKKDEEEKHSYVEEWKVL